MSKNLSDRLAAVSDQLTPTERRIANTLLGDPTKIAFGTVAAVAETVQSSGPSVVRFAQKLGFDGYSDFQHAVRAGLSRELARPVERIHHGSTELVEVAQTAASSIDVNLEKILSVANPIATRLKNANAIWVISGETSTSGAKALVSGLSMIRPRVNAIDLEEFPVALADASTNDLLVVIDFYRYRRAVMEAAQMFYEKGTPLVVITDGPLSPFAPLADELLPLHIPAIGPLDSAVPVVLAAELLIAKTAQLSKKQSEDRFTQFEKAWDNTSTYLDG